MALLFDTIWSEKWIAEKVKVKENSGTKVF